MISWKKSNRIAIIAVVVVVGIFVIYSLTNTFSKTIHVNDKLKVQQRTSYASSHYYELIDQQGGKYEISLELGEKVQPNTVIQAKGRKTLFGNDVIVELLPTA
jgi:hypothetical protein